MLVRRPVALEVRDDVNERIPQLLLPSGAWLPHSVPSVRCAGRSARCGTLSNGMQAVLAESRTFPKISAQLFFRSGNAVVARRAPGLAEMTATVVRTGTASRPSRQIEEDLRRMGADLGTHAGADSSSISAGGLAEFSADILELIADLARNASFPDEEFERERRQKLEELKHRTHHAGVSCERTLARSAFWRASLCGHCAHGRTSGRVSPRATRGILSPPLRAVRCAADRCRRFLHRCDV